MPIVLIIVAVLALVVVGTCVMVYNGIVKMDNRCNNAWETIEVQLRRRNDLVRDLLSLMKDRNVQLEPQTIAAVAIARSSVLDANTLEAKMVASNELASALNHLLSVTDDCPELEDDRTYQQLCVDFADTQNKISYARMSYNDCALEYNNSITTFPGNVVAGSRFRKRHGFEAAGESVRKSPQVHL